MGLVSGLAERLLRKKNIYKFNGNLITLGAQSILLTPYNLKKIINQEKIKIKPSLINKLDVLEKTKKFISRNEFFKLCGAESIKSLDVSGYQNADILFDLNDDILPKNLQETADFIFDGSTIEHIFNIKNVLLNLNKILKKNGFIFHLSPLEGLSHDGFYQFGTCFFPETYQNNRYKIVSHEVFVFDYENKIFNDEFFYKEGKNWFFSDLKEGIEFSRKHNLPAQHLFLAQKQSNDLSFEIPYQGRYFNNSKWKKNLKV